MNRIYKNRSDAGRVLADRLEDHSRDKNLIVLALPRGGIPVGYEIATAFNVPMDVFLVRKLGLLGHEELAMGAIASGGVRVLNESLIRALQVRPETIELVARKEQAELERREEAFRGSRPFPQLEQRNVILVDDGLATGSTMRAAIEAVRQQKPQRLIVAVPVGAVESCQKIEPLVDELVCPLQPANFMAVGQWYDDFSQIEDEEVRELLDRVWEKQPRFPKESNQFHPKT